MALVQCGNKECVHRVRQGLHRDGAGLADGKSCWRCRRLAARTGTIYVLHFSGSFHHAQHYIGWCHGDDPTRRIGQHLDGIGSPLVKAALAAGLTVELVTTQRGTRSDERALKMRKNARGLCPVCLPHYRSEARERMRLHRMKAA